MTFYSNEEYVVIDNRTQSADDERVRLGKGIWSCGEVVNGDVCKTAHHGHKFHPNLEYVPFYNKRYAEIGCMCCTRLVASKNGLHRRKCLGYKKKGSQIQSYSMFAVKRCNRRSKVNIPKTTSSIRERENMKNMKPIITAVAFLGASVIFPQRGKAQELSAHPAAQDSVKQDNALFEIQLRQLDQEVKVLKRLRDLDLEAAAQKQAEKSPLGQVKVSGIVFADYFYNIARDTAVASGVTVKNIATGGPQDFNGFQFRRVYVTFDDDVTENVFWRFRLEDDQIAATSGGTNNLFVKDAYLKWKGIFPGSDAAVGEQQTPLEISEAAWGYRSLEKVQLDLRGITTTRDLGISLRGRLDKEGDYNYWVFIANNSNTGVESDKYKRYYANFQVKPFVNFQISVSGDYAAQAPAANIGSRDKTTVSALINYSVKDAYSVGLEGFSQIADHSFQPSAGDAYESLVPHGASLFAWYTIVPGLTAIVRYDYFDPNTNGAVTAQGDSRNLIIAGLSWKADKSLSIQPNIEYETYEEKPAAGIVQSKSYNSSVTGKITFVLQY